MEASVKTVLMNFSGIYRAEGFLPAGAVVLDLCDIEGTSCYCDSGSSDEIRRIVGPYGYRGIHWLDSGDYHYASLFWLEKVDVPFSIVLFDNHPDDQPVAFDASVLSCGSWMLHARNLPLLAEMDGKPAAVHFKDAGSALSVNPETLFPGLPVYLSIDKDVLGWKDAHTDWDQGTMTLDELMTAVGRIASAHTILGVDVCGELSVGKGAVESDLITNRRTNDILQDFLLNLKI